MSQVEWMRDLIQAADDLGFNVKRVEPDAIEMYPRNRYAMSITVEGVLLSGPTLRELFARGRVETEA